MKEKILFELTLVSDDETGHQEAGEFDLTLHTMVFDRWIERPGSRERLARELRRLAQQAEDATGLFYRRENA